MDREGPQSCTQSSERNEMEHGVDAGEGGQQWLYY